MSTPRDFRDPVDIDEALDCIRVATREGARELYLTCLETAYRQGRMDMLAKLMRSRIIDGKEGGSHG
jgi:hypothetical protein